MKYVRKILSTLLVFLLGISCFSMLSLADDVWIEGDYEYTMTDGEVIITKYTGEGGNVTIPSTLGGLPVTTIGSFAILNASTIESIVIPEGVTTILGQAFAGCSMKKIVLPESLTEIGKAAFCFCTKLETVSIPSGITIIEDNTFQECSSLTEVLLPEGVTTIKKEAFVDCSNLKEITLPTTVDLIDKKAFAASTMLHDVYLDITIYSKAAGAAKVYAKKHNISFVTITEYTTETLGDINGDDSINAQDALLALQHSVRLIDLRGDSLSMADMNQDDFINARDALQILQQSVGL